MENLILGAVTAFLLTYLAIPSVIHIALKKNLCDQPGGRRSHSVPTPSLGGVAIYTGLFFSMVLWTPFASFANLQYILCAFIIIFLVGLKDDLTIMSANKKLILQLVAIGILVVKSDIRLEGFYGFFGWETPLPYLASVLFSMFTLLVIINSFNLIDGINGLAGSLCVLVGSTLGIWFYNTGHPELAILAAAAVGATLGFLPYNITPARIFMGDTGSLTLGMVTGILIVKFININEHLPPAHDYHLEAIPAVAIGIIMLPIFDTLRVFTTRIYRGQPPFRADRRHIHHLLIDNGYSHMQATGILVLCNALFILFVLLFQRYVEQHLLLILSFSIAGGLTFLLHMSVYRRGVKEESSLPGKKISKQVGEDATV